MKVLSNANLDRLLVKKSIKNDHHQIYIYILKVLLKIDTYPRQLPSPQNFILDEGSSKTKCF